jgi:GNAT superfamily N-acetyltransferase
MPRQLVIRPAWVNAPIFADGIQVGELNFDYVDYRCPTSMPVNVTSDEYLTKRRMLRAPIANALGVKNYKVDRAFVGTGTYVEPKYAGNGYGRRAMAMFLRSWATMADIVIVNAQPIGKGGTLPTREKLIEIWSSVGFVLPHGHGRRMFYLPNQIEGEGKRVLQMLKDSNRESREEGYL